MKKYLEKYMDWVLNNKTKAIGYSIAVVTTLIILFSAFSCTTDTMIIEDKPTLEEVEKRQNIKCDVFEFPAEADYDYVIARLNNETNWHVYSRFLEYPSFYGFTVANFPCDPNPYGYSDGNGMNFYDDIVWRWELYDEQDVKMKEGCFTSVCYATNVPLKGKKLKSGNYYLKFIDFPEVTTQFNVIIP